jgi:hypothetical protein
VNSDSLGKTVTLNINVTHKTLGHSDAQMVKVIAGLQGWTLTGTFLSCGSYALAKAHVKGDQGTFTENKDRTKGS